MRTHEIADSLIIEKESVLMWQIILACSGLFSGILLFVAIRRSMKKNKEKMGELR
jgi:hypothetical protein